MGGMPTYDYECSRCKHRFEIFEPMSAKGRRKCPKCGARAKRALTAPGGVIIRGKSSPSPKCDPETFRNCAAAKDGT
jgi:putative FmdB family regulatory protein